MSRPKPQTAYELDRQTAREIAALKRRGRPKPPVIPEPPPVRKVAAGRVTAAGNPSGDVTITFPAGRFTGLANNQIAVTATLGGFGVNAAILVTNITTTGCSILTYLSPTGANTGGLPFSWIATEVG